MKAHIIMESSIMETNYCGPTIMEPTIMETNLLWQPTIMEAHIITIMALPKMVDGPKRSILQIRQRVNFKSQGEYCVQL